MDELTVRNFKSIQEAINHIASDLGKQTTRNDQLHALIAAQQATVQQLSQDVAVLKAMVHGTGPTVRS